MSTELLRKWTHVVLYLYKVKVRHRGKDCFRVLKECLRPGTKLTITWIYFQLDGNIAATQLRV